MREEARVVVSKGGQLDPHCVQIRQEVGGDGGRAMGAANEWVWEEGEALVAGRYGEHKGVELRLKGVVDHGCDGGGRRATPTTLTPRTTPAPPPPTTCTQHREPPGSR